jgi:hypothetical protein
MLSVANGAPVTVTDKQGRRYTLDVNANRSYDAAILTSRNVVRNPAFGILLDVVRDHHRGQDLHVEGQKLKEWIEWRRIDSNGPRGHLSSQRRCWSRGATHSLP